MAIIRNQQELDAARQWLFFEEARIEAVQATLKEQGYKADEIQAMLGLDLLAFADKSQAVLDYHSALRGDVVRTWNLAGIGRLIITLRLAKRMSLDELSGRLLSHSLSVEELEQYEKNEYRELSLEKANEILDALDVFATTDLEQLYKSH